MQVSDNLAAVTERHPDWNSIDWKKANRNVRNLRQRIFRATQESDLRKVRSLQKLMLRSYIEEGFDFLGFNIRRYRGKNGEVKTLIKPSKDSVSKIRSKLREEWMNLKNADVKICHQQQTLPVVSKLLEPGAS